MNKPRLIQLIRKKTALRKRQKSMPASYPEHRLFFEHAEEMIQPDSPDEWNFTPMLLSLLYDDATDLAYNSIGVLADAMLNSKKPLDLEKGVSPLQKKSMAMQLFYDFDGLLQLDPSIFSHNPLPFHAHSQKMKSALETIDAAIEVFKEEGLKNESGLKQTNSLPDLKNSIHEDASQLMKWIFHQAVTKSLLRAMQDKNSPLVLKDISSQRLKEITSQAYQTAMISLKKEGCFLSKEKETLQSIPDTILDFAKILCDADLHNYENVIKFLKGRKNPDSISKTLNHTINIFAHTHPKPSHKEIQKRILNTSILSATLHDYNTQPKANFKPAPTKITQRENPLTKTLA